MCVDAMVIAVFRMRTGLPLAGGAVAVRAAAAARAVSAEAGARLAAV